MQRRIHVTGLFEMPRHVGALRPTHLVSILQPEFQPVRPPSIARERHLRVQVHDVTADDGISVVPGRRHVAEILRFLGAWEDEAEGDLLVHCYAGVSRSTAVALIGLARASRDPAAAVATLRAAAPHAMPNRLIVALADELLDLGGGLSEACAGLGPPSYDLRGEPLATLLLAARKER
ncbi:MAG: protein tyrosine phosphatase [Acidobacteria bacterium]|nr:MAG: protein tyrosine phosphatase [Acidobacteriota bacterium]REK01087.1 MAG: protein tyrosine phosphatase [Acidobacteriota bacterium]